MLNQSFSAENLRSILERENKKGLNFETRYFPELSGILADIGQCNDEIKKRRKILDPKTFKIFKKEMEGKTERLIKRKEEQLTGAIQCLRDKIIGGNFSLELDKVGSVGGKDIYTMNRSIESFLILKQVQSNIKNAYHLKLPNRFKVLNQLIEVLKDSAPKVILVTDIKQFSDTIPQDRVLSRLNNEGLLDPFSLNIILKILGDYKIKYGLSNGSPRGVGVSTYLNELYMKDVDDGIKLLPGVISYLRFGDDIIITFSPSLDENKDYLKEIKGIVEGKFGLKLNEQKTFLFDLTKPGQRHFMNYLGYRISFGGGLPLNIGLAERKLDKYKKRIDLTFDSYLNLSRINEKKARKIFVKRIRFLTGNTRLLNDGNILAGIYYSNSMLNDISDLTVLDQYLARKIGAFIHLPQLKDRLNKFSYKEGFLQKRFSPFSVTDLNKIVGIWKNEI